MYRENVLTREFRSPASPRAVIAATVASTIDGHHSRSGTSSVPVATVVAAGGIDNNGSKRSVNSTPRGGPSTPGRGPDNSPAHGGAQSRSGTGRSGAKKRGSSITLRAGRTPRRGVPPERSTSAGSRRRTRSVSTPPSPPLPTPCFENGEVHGDSVCSSARCRAGSSEQQTRDQLLFRKAQSGAESSVRVAVRFRPLKLEEGSEGPAFRVRPDGRIVESGDLSYSFELDRAFASEVSQAQVYHEVGFPVVSDVLNGYNGTVLAYGQTGSGKTHCMFGPTLELSAQHGLIPRAARQIFDTIRSGSVDVGYVLRCSLLEVYCEQLRDLLDPSNGDLRISETPQRGVLVEGLTQECVEREEDVLDILRTGEQMRVVACTKLNNFSSRSHVLFFLSCAQRLPDGSEKVGKLSLADLAGSERVGNSGALTAGGARLQEATKINCSLSALGHVIQTLVERQAHVPYRNSQLTRVLQDTLGGNCKTALIVTCSAASSNYGETLSSLRFATRARLVRNRVKVNLIRSSEQLTHLVAQLQRELVSARREAKRLGLDSESLTFALAGNPLPTPLPEDGTDAGESSCDESANEACDVDPSTATGRTKLRYASLENSALMRQSLEEVMGEVRELESALEIQDEQLKASMKASSLASAPPEIAEACDFFSRRGRVKSLTGRSAVCKLREKELSLKVVEAEDKIARLEDDLAIMFERRRTQRLLARRQEAQNAIGCNVLAKDDGQAADVLGESMLSFHVDRSTGQGTSSRQRRSFASRTSKVVRPISRRSIERRSVGGTSSASSHSATPRIGSPRGNGCELEDASWSPAPECKAMPITADTFNTELPQMVVDACPLGSMKLPATSTFIQHATVPPENTMLNSSSKMPAPRNSSRETARGQTKAWFDMVDDDTVPSNAITKLKSMPISSQLSEEEQLRRQIAQLRSKQERDRSSFEERRRREDEEFRRQHGPALQHLSDLEATWKSSRGAIPCLRLELEQVDMALEEAEATKDALELEFIRLGRTCAYQVQRLNLRRGLVERMLPQKTVATDFESVYLRAAGTLQHLSRCVKTVSAHASGSASSDMAVGKENGPPLCSTNIDGKYWQHTPVRRHSNVEGMSTVGVVNTTGTRSLSADSCAARLAISPALFVRPATSYPVA